MKFWYFVRATKRLLQRLLTKYGDMATQHLIDICATFGYRCNDWNVTRAEVRIATLYLMRT